MSDPALLAQGLHHTHPHTHALADVQPLPQEPAPAHTSWHRRSSSGHSHNAIAAAVVAAVAGARTPATPPPPASLPAPTSTPRSVLAVSSSPMPKLFKIEIAHNGECKSSNPIFYPSDLIHGMVYLYLDKPMTLPALKIVFRGESNYPSSKQQDHLDHHMRRLFSVAMTLWGSRDPLPEEQWGQLPAGNHIFPFTIQLPDKNLPASFDHPWLKNQYTLTAYYRRPNGLSKWQSKAKPINFMPLSTPGTEHGPIQESCPKMGTALLLSHPDLAPGGRVHVKLTAAAAIDRCQFALSRHIRARINETTYKEDEVICHYERKSIPKGEFSLVLPIPKITPPTTESSSALKITYSVQVSIWNERFFFKTESHNFDFPIVIRTLPSCDNRTCEGLDWCEPSVDRPMFLTEPPMLPLPLYESDQSPPKYTLDLPAYEQVATVEGGGSTISTALQSLSLENQEQEQAQAQEQAQVQAQEQVQEQDLQRSELDHHDDHDRASTHSVESTSSEHAGHEQTVPDHPSPHHPSCLYYVAPRDSLQSLTALSSTSINNPNNNNNNNRSSISSSSSGRSNDSMRSERLSFESQTVYDDNGSNAGPSQPHGHNHPVDFLKVQTIIESV
ncbi:hypothetical protein EC968_003797 [Mortierella alpina]|nr:hypothetical protein EC968_003797 [Mortierella alpina]